jgi:hypothetical protein
MSGYGIITYIGDAEHIKRGADVIYIGPVVIYRDEFSEFIFPLVNPIVE